MNIETLYDLYRRYPAVQTDSRNLRKGEIFFALKGPNFNGNDFAQKALDLSAAYVIADEDRGIKDERILLVDDVLQTLQALARYHREQFSIPFIAITGSNGKTTTKELIHQVLSSTYRTYTTRGNLNNHIGIPLTLLRIGDDAEMAVIEMGANHLHEIAGYCLYAQPTHGLITNIGKAHLEGFGGAENVKKGKGELFQYLKKYGGTAFVNTDDKAVLEIGQKVEHAVFYGSQSDHFKGKIVKNDPFIEVEAGADIPFQIKTHLVGAYNLPNVLAAVCLGRYFNVEERKIKTAIEEYQPSNSRSQLIRQGSNTIVLDAYNANPGSMKAAIENFASMRGEKKILLLGSMMELGTDSKKEHQTILDLIGRHDWESVVLVGSQFAEVNEKYISCESAEKAGEWLKQFNPQNALILVKGSRSMQMEKALTW